MSINKKRNNKEPKGEKNQKENSLIKALKTVANYLIGFVVLIFLVLVIHYVSELLSDNKIFNTFTYWSQIIFYSVLGLIVFAFFIYGIIAIILDKPLFNYGPLTIKEKLGNLIFLIVFFLGTSVIAFLLVLDSI